MPGQKAPSAKRCIKTPVTPRLLIADGLRQKAPSAKRCIKTAMNIRAGMDAVKSESTERQKVH